MKSVANQLTWAKHHVRLSVVAPSAVERTDHLRFALQEAQDAVAEIARQLREAASASAPSNQPNYPYQPRPEGYQR